MFEKDRIDRGLWWDQALNLVYGCSKMSDGCRGCWAMREAHMRKSNPNPKIQALYKDLTDNQGEWTGNIRFVSENLNKPIKRKKPTVWAVWNDLFSPNIGGGFGVDSVIRAINTMIACKQHLFVILTKRPITMSNTLDRMIFGTERRTMNPIDLNMPNIFWGTTVENVEQTSRLQTMLPTKLLLSEIQNSLKFVISFEPLLERIPASYFSVDINVIKWVIVGGESGPNCRPMDPDWAREIRDMCERYKIPFFFKQMGGHPSKRNYFRDIPEDLRIRELPIVGQNANGTR